jgi:drug/metabolite transporter (DMT)-like permease
MEPSVAVGRHVPTRAWLAALAAFVGVYLLTLENGAVLAQGAEHLHELFHDARHFVGAPCH